MSDWSRRELIAAGACSLPFVFGGCVAAPSASGFPITPKGWTAAEYMSTHWEFNYQKPDVFSTHRNHLSDEFRENYQLMSGTWRDLASLAPEDLTVELRYSGVGICQTKTDERDLESRIDEGFFSKTESHKGYTIWAPTRHHRRGPDGVAVALKGKILLHVVGGEPPALNRLKTVLDVGEGNAPTYATESDAAESLMRHLDTATWVWGQTRDPPNRTNSEKGIFAGNSADGHAWTLDGEMSTVKRVLIFEDSTAADAEAVKSWLRFQQQRPKSETYKPWGYVNETTITKLGRAVEIRGTVQTSELSLGDPNLDPD